MRGVLQFGDSIITCSMLSGGGKMTIFDVKVPDGAKSFVMRIGAQFVWSCQPDVLNCVVVLSRLHSRRWLALITLTDALLLSLCCCCCCCQGGSFGSLPETTTRRRKRARTWACDEP